MVLAVGQPNRDCVTLHALARNAVQCSTALQCKYGLQSLACAVMLAVFADLTEIMLVL